MKNSCSWFHVIFSYFTGRVPDNPEIRANSDGGEHNKSAGGMANVSEANANNNTSSGSADLLGLGLSGGSGSAPETNNTMNGNGFSSEAPVNNLTK